LFILCRNFEVGVPVLFLSLLKTLLYYRGRGGNRRIEETSCCRKGSVFQGNFPISYWILQNDGAFEFEMNMDRLVLAAHSTYNILNLNECSVENKHVSAHWFYYYVFMLLFVFFLLFMLLFIK